MYAFAVVALLGLATLKVVDLLAEYVPSFAGVRTLATFALAIGAVAALNYSLFQGFGINVRHDWIGTMITGVIVGSLAPAWAAVLGYLGVREGTDGGHRRADRPRIAA